MVTLPQTLTPAKACCTRRFSPPSFRALPLPLCHTCAGLAPLQRIVHGCLRALCARSSPVRLPPCRAHELEEIVAEAKANPPVEFYGCSLAMETEGVLDFLCNLYLSLGLIEPPHEPTSPSASDRAGRLAPQRPHAMILVDGLGGWAGGHS